jgi:hypothetical protein
LYQHVTEGAGDDLPFYEAIFVTTARGLFVNGWAGRKSDGEQRFVNAHQGTLSPTAQRQRAGRAERMRGLRARTPATEYTGTHPGRVRA